MQLFMGNKCGLLSATKSTKIMSHRNFLLYGITTWYGHSVYVTLSTCLFVSLSQSICLPVYRPVYLSWSVCLCVLLSLSLCLPTSISACLCLPACLSIHLSLPACLPACLPTCLCLPAYEFVLLVSLYLLASQLVSRSLLVGLFSTCLPACLPVVKLTVPPKAWYCWDSLSSDI